MVVKCFFRQSGVNHTKSKNHTLLWRLLAPRLGYHRALIRDARFVLEGIVCDGGSQFSSIHLFGHVLLPNWCLVRTQVLHGFLQRGQNSIRAACDLRQAHIGSHEGTKLRCRMHRPYRPQQRNWL